MKLGNLENGAMSVFFPGSCQLNYFKQKRKILLKGNYNGKIGAFLFTTLVSWKLSAFIISENFRSIGFIGQVFY